MRHKSMWIGLILVLALAWTMNAYADSTTGEVTAWQGFWNSIGGFLYNALPWNWGNWAGK